jgi:hypothetical protein
MPRLSSNIDNHEHDEDEEGKRETDDEPSVDHLGGDLVGFLLGWFLLFHIVGVEHLLNKWLKSGVLEKEL